MSGAICGDGMCPWNPCVKFPKCKHKYPIDLDKIRTPKEVTK